MTTTLQRFIPLASLLCSAAVGDLVAIPNCTVIPAISAYAVVENSGTVSYGTCTNTFCKWQQCGPQYKYAQGCADDPSWQCYGM